MIMFNSLYASDRLNNPQSLNNTVVKLSQFSVSGQFATFGDDVNCDYHSQNDSINAIINSGIADIRITNQIEIDQQIIIPQDVDQTFSIVGGYDDCTDAQSSELPNNKTTINGNNTLDNLVRILANESQTIYLMNLNLTDSISSAMSLEQFDSTVNFINSDVSSSGSALNQSGGGIFVDGLYATNQSVPSLLMYQVNVFDNQAANGGGIYCRNSSITLLNESGVYNNLASLGGGIAAYNGCYINYLSGTDDLINSDIGIHHNHATNGGGGILLLGDRNTPSYGSPHLYIDSGSNLATNGKPLNINSNTADFIGGGIYIVTDGELTASGVLLAENQSLNGAGIATFRNVGQHADSKININISQINNSCWSKAKCNQLINNFTDINDGKGGLMNFTNHSGIADGLNVKVAQSWIEGNRSDWGVILYNNAAGNFTFEGNIITNNGNNGSNFHLDDYLFYIRKTNTAHQLDFNLAYNTIIDNKVNQYLLTTLNTSFIRFKAHGNIIEDKLPLCPPSNNYVLNCNISNIADPFTASNSQQTIIDTVNFMDNPNQDFRLMSDSIAIDRCEEVAQVYESQFKDLDYNDRGIDNQLIVDDLGSFDIGAYEFITDLLFNDSFEEL